MSDTYTKHDKIYTILDPFDNKYELPKAILGRTLRCNMLARNEITDQEIIEFTREKYPEGVRCYGAGINEGMSEQHSKFDWQNDIYYYKSKCQLI